MPAISFSYERPENDIMSRPARNIFVDKLVGNKSVFQFENGHFGQAKSTNHFLFSFRFIYIYMPNFNWIVLPYQIVGDCFLAHGRFRKFRLFLCRHGGLGRERIPSPRRARTASAVGCKEFERLTRFLRPRMGISNHSPPLIMKW